MISQEDMLGIIATEAVEGGDYTHNPPQRASIPNIVENKQAIHESLQRQREQRTKRVKSILP